MKGIAIRILPVYSLQNLHPIQKTLGREFGKIHLISYCQRESNLVPQNQSRKRFKEFNGLNLEALVTFPI